MWTLGNRSEISIFRGTEAWWGFGEQPVLKCSFYFSFLAGCLLYIKHNSLKTPELDT